MSTEQTINFGFSLVQAARERSKLERVQILTRLDWNIMRIYDVDNGKNLKNRYYFSARNTLGNNTNLVEPFLVAARERVNECDKSNN